MSDEAISAILLGLMLVGAVWAWVDPQLPRMLERWAHAQGYKVVRFKVPRFHEGPSGRRRNDDFRDETHITVQDAQGRTRNGWIVHENRWGLWSYKFKEVIWEDEWA